jgi:hypothetical protein
MNRVDWGREIEFQRHAKEKRDARIAKGEIKPPSYIRKTPEEKEATKRRLARERRAASCERRREYRRENRSEEFPVFIEDETLFKAVSFAKTIRKNDKCSYGLAIHKAAKHYKVSEEDVAREVGNIGRGRRQWKISVKDD